jgi:gluconate 2-dehydrogenase gamma chain
MNRRQSLKAIGIGTISTGVLLEACKDNPKEVANLSSGHKAIPGRQDFEINRDKQLHAETFFTPHETATIVLLADIIIPKDEVSGSASDAKVSEFIEFIVKDEPEHQLPMRGGLRWLDMQCLNRFGNDFKTCTPSQQLELVNAIAYPFQPKHGLEQGVSFFNKMRDLTAIGFFTSEMGIADLGYKGNTPGKWEGVPQDVLKQYGLEGV